MLRTFFVAFILIITLFLPVQALADENLTNVNHVANVVEKFREKITLFFKLSSNDKYNYKKYLVEKRLREVEYVINTKQLNLVEETTSRYSTYLSDFSQFVIDSNLLDKKEDTLALYSDHEKILEDMRNNFEFDSAFDMLIRHDINTIKLFSEKIKN